MEGEWGQQGDQGDPGTRGVGGVPVSRHAPCLKKFTQKRNFTQHLSLFTHPQVVQNRYDFIGRLVTKELTSITFIFDVIWKSMLPATVWLKTFFQISYFVFNRGNKLIYV